MSRTRFVTAISRSRSATRPQTQTTMSDFDIASPPHGYSSVTPCMQPAAAMDMKAEETQTKPSISVVSFLLVIALVSSHLCRKTVINLTPQRTLALQIPSMPKLQLQQDFFSTVCHSQLHLPQKLSRPSRSFMCATARQYALVPRNFRPLICS